MDQANVELLEKLLYTTTTPDEQIHCCVVVIDRKHAVTFKHGPHSSIEKGATLDLYNVKDRNLIIKVAAIVISDNDLIIFEVVGDGMFPAFPPNRYMYPGQNYVQVGVNEDRTFFWKKGIIQRRGAGYYVGSSHGADGDSGSGIFDMSGSLIGISVAKKNFGFSKENHVAGSTINYGGVADHYADTQIISADVIFSHLPIKDSAYRPPEPKRAMVSQYSQS